jgi:HEXXH motif-containing protein
MITVHELGPEVFEGLATGDGGAEAVRGLRKTQFSKHLMLIRYLLKQFPDGGHAVRHLLDRSRDADPQQFQAVLGAPLVGGWAAIACRAAMKGNLDETDLRHLDAIAIVAAAAAAIDGAADIPVHNGLAVLPGLGAIEADDARLVRVTTTGGRLFATVGGVEREVPSADGWQPVHMLAASSNGQAIELGLDDLHPYRHGHHLPPRNRLAGAEVERWRASFGEAWRLLATHLPARSAELSAGLQTLVPLVQLEPRSARSATIRHAFGVFGLTLPPTPQDFAVTLVHEFQHSKLSAVLDLTQLTDPDDNGRYFAPWRTDPRPLAGLLQGVYAFVGVADTWRGLRAEIPAATARFAESRLQVDRGLTAIEGSGALTAPGWKFVAELRRSADRLLAEPLPAQANTNAQAALARTYDAWKDRNAS